MIVIVMLTHFDDQYKILCLIIVFLNIDAPTAPLNSVYGPLATLGGHPVYSCTLHPLLQPRYSPDVWNIVIGFHKYFHITNLTQAAEIWAGAFKNILC